MANGRVYRTLYPTFWTGDTGRRIKAGGPALQVLALYLCTSPHANMIGLYYLPLAYIAADTGLPEADVRSGLERLTRLSFAEYDHATEWVWVRETWRYVIGQDPGRDQHRLAGAVNLLDKAPCEIAQRFASRYGSPFQAPTKPLGSPLVAPTKPLASPHQAPPIPEIRDQRSENREQRTENSEPEGAAPPLSTSTVWDDWRDEWNASPKRRPLSLNPINGDIPKLAEVAKRFPDDARRRALIHEYFTTENRRITQNPYSVGWFLHWADKLAEALLAADEHRAAEKEWLAS